MRGIQFAVGVVFLLASSLTFAQERSRSVGTYDRQEQGSDGSVLSGRLQRDSQRARSQLLMLCDHQHPSGGAAREECRESVPSGTDALIRASEFDSQIRQMRRDVARQRAQSRIDRAHTRDSRGMLARCREYSQGVAGNSRAKKAAVMHMCCETHELRSEECGSQEHRAEARRGLGTEFERFRDDGVQPQLGSGFLMQSGGRSDSFDSAR